MIHYSDIQDAITRRDIREIEDSFRAFVGFPKEEEIAGIGTLDDFMTAFAQICEALRIDERIMPSATADDLADVAGHFELRHFDRTYAAGSGLVLTLLAHFRARNSRHFGGSCQ